MGKKEVNGQRMGKIGKEWAQRRREWVRFALGPLECNGNGAGAQGMCLNYFVLYFYFYFYFYFVTLLFCYFES